MRRTFGAALVLQLAWAGIAWAQPGGAGMKAVPFAVSPVPFGPGEELHYRIGASWFLIRGGGYGSMKVEAIDTVHGHPTYRLAFAMQGGIAFWHMDDVQRSWLDVNTLFARRFQQKIDQTTYDRDRTLEFFPNAMRWERVHESPETGELVPQTPRDTGRLASDMPLDDVSFLYHVRTIPLEVGVSYTEPRYYKEDGNPVTVRVLRKERVKVPAGEFDAIVVQPIIETDGLFSKDGEAEAWFTDDERRLLVKLKARVSIGTLTMELQSYVPGLQLLGVPDTLTGKSP